MVSRSCLMSKKETGEKHGLLPLLLQFQLHAQFLGAVKTRTGVVVSRCASGQASNLESYTKRLRTKTLAAFCPVIKMHSSTRVSLHGTH